MDKGEDMELIGKHVMYFDFLGIDSFGYIVAIEPGPEPDIVYCYIEDEDMEDNIHEDVVNGKKIKYAEIRLSSEVYPD